MIRTEVERRVGGYVNAENEQGKTARRMVDRDEEQYTGSYAWLSGFGDRTGCTVELGPVVASRLTVLQSVQQRRDRVARRRSRRRAK